jgi:undecaprenyl-diphosphatase
MPDWLSAIILGIIEGATEFIPVSSTGHLLLAQRALHLTTPFWDVFAVMIQLGAILSVVVLYFQRLIVQVIRLPSDPAARRFALTIIIACVPAVLIALAFRHVIEGIFQHPEIICGALILGGIVLILLDRWQHDPRFHDAMALPLRTAAGIGAIQCLAFIPGVSRSGATIIGGMAMGLDRPAAAEFSFFLAIPIMVGAFVFDFKEHYHEIMGPGLGTIAIGFVVSFIVGLLVVRWLIGFVSKNGFGLFGWWRIVVGVLGLGMIYLVH